MPNCINKKKSIPTYKIKLQSNKDRKKDRGRPRGEDLTGANKRCGTPSTSNRPNWMPSLSATRETIPWPPRNACNAWNS